MLTMNATVNCLPLLKASVLEKSLSSAVRLEASENGSTFFGGFMIWKKKKVKI